MESLCGLSVILSALSIVFFLEENLEGVEIMLLGLLSRFLG